MEGGYEEDADMDEVDDDEEIDDMTRHLQPSVNDPRLW